MFAIRANEKREQVTNALIERQPGGIDCAERRAHLMDGVMEEMIMESAEESILVGKSSIERAHRTFCGPRKLGRGNGIEPLVFEERRERGENALARGPAALLPRGAPVRATSPRRKERQTGIGVHAPFLRVETECQATIRLFLQWATEGSCATMLFAARW